MAPALYSFQKEADTGNTHRRMLTIELTTVHLFVFLSHLHLKTFLFKRQRKTKTFLCYSISL